MFSVPGEATDPRILDDNPYNDDDMDFFMDRESLQKTIDITTRPDENAQFPEEEYISMDDLNSGRGPMFYVNFEVNQPNQACFIEIKPNMGLGALL